MRSRRARAAGIPDNGYEVQLLWGMAEPVHEAFCRLGFRLRVYSPMGELVPGMAYLVRRLLENTSNESFVRLRFAEHKDLASLVAAPVADLAAPSRRRARPGAGRATGDERGQARAVRARASRALVRAGGAEAHGRGFREGARLARGRGARPCRRGRDRHPTDDRLGRPCRADEGRRRLGLLWAGRSRPGGRGRRVRPSRRGAARPAAVRAEVLFRAADCLRRHKLETAALEVFEAGKCWDDADADVAEAIDFLEYYGREALRLAEGGRVQSPPGEVNRLSYHGRGVAAVISPWNFPLAIPSRDGERGTRRRQHGRAQACRADPRRRRRARAGAARGRPSRRGPLVPARPRRGGRCPPRHSPRREPRRLHRLQAGWARHRGGGRAHRRRPTARSAA